MTDRRSVSLLCYCIALKSSRIVRFDEFAARESSGGKFGPPPPTDRSRGQGFVNLSFRDTALQVLLHATFRNAWLLWRIFHPGSDISAPQQDGIEEARTASDDLDEAGEGRLTPGALQIGDLAQLKVVMC